MKLFPTPLTPDEERYYLERYREGDQQAKQILIERNMRLVAHLVKKYHAADRDIEDLISVGTIGLIKAVNTFNTDKNNRLAAYASKCVENELLMLFRSEKKRTRESSLYEPLGTDAEGNSIRLLDVLECEEEDILERVDMEEKTGRLYELMKRLLSDREKEIICLRYGLAGTKEVTQREIADAMGISRSYPADIIGIKKCRANALRICVSRWKERYALERAFRTDKSVSHRRASRGKVFPYSIAMR